MASLLAASLQNSLLRACLFVVSEAIENVADLQIRMTMQCKVERKVPHALVDVLIVAYGASRRSSDEVVEHHVHDPVGDLRGQSAMNQSSSDEGRTLAMCARAPTSTGSTTCTATLSDRRAFFDGRSDRLSVWSYPFRLE